MIVSGSTTLTYAQLDALVDRQAEELLKHPLTPFVATQDLDFVVTYLAHHRAGLPAIPVSQPSPYLSELLQTQPIPRGTADILLTTGTTGDQKAILLSHDAISASTQNLLSAHPYTPDTTFIITGPLNHLGSLSKLWATMAAGGTVVITQGMKDVNTFYAATKGRRHLATFLVPSSISILLTLSHERLAALDSQFDFIETGAAPISQQTMRCLAQTLPSTPLFNTYASTEVGIVATYNFNDGRQLPACVGQTMTNSTIEISPDGLITVAGPTLMTGYLGSAPLPRQRLTTQDRGYFDADHNLFFAGREGDILNVGGYKVNPLEVENIAMSHPAVSECVLVAVEHPSVGSALKLLIVRRPDATATKRDIALYLSKHVERYALPQLYDFVESIPKTFNGKIDRKNCRATL